MKERTTPRWVFWAGLVITLVGAMAVGAWSLTMPYYAYSAGPVGDAVESLVVRDGVTVYPPDGELLFLTVSVQEVNPYEMAAAALDPSIDLVRREAVRPANESDQQFRERGLNQMDQSKEQAISVALSKLGDEHLITSDGVQVVDLIRTDLPEGTLQVDDIITAIDGVPVTLSSDIRQLLDGKRPGDVIRVSLTRDGKPLTADIPLYESPDEPGRPLVGILAQTANPQLPIDISTGNIGGPSAGMMYTLAIIDDLSPGDLTKGHVVAGTGTINADGTVGAIGGIRQKVVAAEAAGAEVMLVPTANYQDALTAPRQSMKLVEIANIDDALTFLDSLDPA